MLQEKLETWKIKSSMSWRGESCPVLSNFTLFDSSNELNFDHLCSEQQNKANFHFIRV